MDKTLEQILKLLDKQDDLNAKIRDKIEASLDEFEDDSYDDADESYQDDDEDSEDEDSNKD